MVRKTDIVPALRFSKKRQKFSEHIAGTSRRGRREWKRRGSSWTESTCKSFEVAESVEPSRNKALACPECQVGRQVVVRDETCPRAEQAQPQRA